MSYLPTHIYIYIYILRQVVGYWEHLRSHQDKLSASAMRDGKCGPNNSWCSQVEQLLAKAAADPHPPCPVERRKTKNQVATFLQQQYTGHLSTKLHQAQLKDSRLTSYSMLKTGKAYQRETYLSLCLPWSVAKAITQIRIGCHKLPIATGRLTTPPTETQQRKCKYCPDEVGDETHFMLFCKHQTEEREKLAHQWRITIPHPSTRESDPWIVEAAMRDILTPTDYRQALAIGSFIKKGLGQY